MAPRKRKGTHGGRRAGAGRKATVRDRRRLYVGVSGSIVDLLDARARALGVDRATAIRLALAEWVGHS
jgi:hypothetical protein